MTTSYSILRSRLEAEQKRLTEELEQLMASANPPDERREGSPFGKREEEATEALELEKRLVLEKRIKDQLIGVGRALHKYDEGTYGFCDSCGQPIDPARLEAIPEASLCIKCKSQQAKNARGKAPTG